MGKISIDTDKIFRVSLEGKEASSTIPEDFAVHGGFDYPKVEEHLEGYSIVTLPASIPEGNTTVLTINHNYGYKPSWLVYIDDVDNNLLSKFARLPYTEGNPPFWTFRVDMTTTQMKIVFRYDDWWGSGDLTIPPAGCRFGFKWQIWVND